MLFLPQTWLGKGFFIIINLMIKGAAV